MPGSATHTWACSVLRLMTLSRVVGWPFLAGRRGAGSLGSQLVSDASTPSVEERLCAAENREHALRRMLQLLSERERFVICERFGLNADESERTLEAIGAKLNLTRERVRQIEATGLRKLRQSALRLRAAER